MANLTVAQELKSKGAALSKARTEGFNGIYFGQCTTLATRIRCEVLTFREFLYYFMINRQTNDQPSKRVKFYDKQTNKQIIQNFFDFRSCVPSVRLLTPKTMQWIHIALEMLHAH